MSTQNGFTRRARAGSVKHTREVIKTNHRARPLRPQTVLAADAPTLKQAISNTLGTSASGGLWSDIKTWRWIVVPASALKLLIIFGALWANWALAARFLSPGFPNPFEPMLFISHRVPSSTDDDPRYQKGYLDLVFIAYHIVFWSFVRQTIILHFFRPFAKWLGVKKERLDRFGEQGYAVVYFAFFGIWGVRIMSQLPTWWYKTEHFWIDYPHWDMKPELKRYYLMQFAYWLHQLIVLALKLEKPRRDYYELVAHHIVTLWLVGWSYLINLTIIGNAVYVSMDIPDVLLSLSMMLDYLQSNLKIPSFAVFVVIWTYFRHYLNLVMLWSVYSQFDLMPETSKHWEPSAGVWMVWWMKWQIFAPILLLQFLNLFWYYLILRIIRKALVDPVGATDVRTDDEDDGEDEEQLEDHDKDD